MSNPWFRMYTDFLIDPKIISLAFEDQRHFIAILALKSDGSLDQDCDEKLKDRIVSQRLWLDFATISDVKKRLVNAGLIDWSWQPLAWNKRQFKSDKDNTAAERQRRFRQSQTSNALRNAPVTRLEADTETDTDSKTDTDTERAINDAPVSVPENPASLPPPTEASLCCQQMRSQGIAQCNPSHPTLLALIEAGATQAEFSQAAKRAVERSKPTFSYVIGIVKGQRSEAAALQLHKGRLPNKQELLEASNKAATSGWLPPELRGKNYAN